jgi:ABC-type proline/glycine betaine transport system ATPase subunit
MARRGCRQVGENLALCADLQGAPRDERGPRYAELVHMTGLRPFTGRLAGRLSGGMKQKVGLACTLVRAPQLLLHEGAQPSDEQPS